jgi:drug/metabolite transporter (DMT)-like permease
MASARFLVAGGVLYTFRRARGDAAPTGREWRSAAIIGILLLAGGNGGVVWAEQRMASGPTALLISSVPLWIVLIEALRPGGRRPARRAVVGVLIGFVGIAVLIGPDLILDNAEKIDPLGAVIVILAALSWSIGSLYGQRARLPSSALLGTGMEMLAGGAGLLVLAILTGEFGQLKLAAVSTQSLWALAYLTVVGSWVGFGAYTWLLRVAPISLVSTYAYVNPVVAVLLGHFLAEEPLTPSTVLAAAIIVGSVALTTTARSSAIKPEAPQPRLLPASED